MSTETKAAFARRLGINKSTITRAAQAGRVVLTLDGRVDVEASLARWEATKGLRGDVAARHAAQRGANVALGRPEAENGTTGLKTGEAETAEEDEAADVKESFTTAEESSAVGEGRAYYQKIGLHYGNSAIKLEMALRRGLRYPRGLVKRESHSMGSTVRAALERIIDQTAPRLAVMTNELERRRLIEDELRKVRWLVKTEMPRSLRRMRAESAKPVAGEGDK